MIANYDLDESGGAIAGYGCGRVCSSPYI